MLLKNRGFSHEEILKLSYPQFNAYMQNIHKVETFSITIPYMGSGKDEENERNIAIENATEFQSKEEIMSIVASMNSDFI